MFAPSPRPGWSLPGLFFTWILLGSPGLAGAAPAGQGGRLFVLMINGGGSREENFASHLSHLRELSAHLLAAGLPKDQISVLSSDGSDPSPDFAQRRSPLARFGLLEGTGLGKELAEPLHFENSTVAGLTLLPATRSALTGWLRSAAGRLHPDDTLFIYVTDHGQDDERDPLRNQITLWGTRAGINVRQLAAGLAHLPRGLRVVTVMSQCFSGGFAQLQKAVPHGSTWQGPVCGYFATSADRPAYGCFPESSTDDRMGHAFSFIDALAARASLPEVHAEVLVADQSPDVPLRSSDVFLADLLAAAAKIAHLDPEVLGDRLLGRGAGPHPPVELAQAARVAQGYQLGPVPTLVQVRTQIDELTGIRDRLSKQQTSWDETIGAANQAALEHFLAAQPAWRPRLRVPALRRLGGSARRSLTSELLAGLRDREGAQAGSATQIEALLDRGDRTAALLYRMEVREAAWLRLRVLLTSAAARLHLATAGSPAQHQQLQTLDSCEALTLPAPAAASPGPPAGKPRPAPTRPPPFPALAADLEIAREIHPSWMGIQFRPAAGPLRRRWSLRAGAALVTTVLPHSPAAAAGLVPGDVVLGEKARPFTRPNDVRAFTMLSPAGKPVGLEILRRGQRQVLEVTPAPAP